MKIYDKPERALWNEMAQRPVFNQEDIANKVQAIIAEVKLKKDAALLNFTSLFDGVYIDRLQVTEDEIENAVESVNSALQQAIKIAYDNIFAFHVAQKTKEQIIETTPGVKCWRKSVGIEKVGLYIPGGTAPLFSTVLMLGIPAKIAACKQVILCTPPNKDGNIDPIILFTAQLVGITEIYKVGGAQAIAAMAYGTDSIPAVYKIFGPGNQFVTKAKELIQQDGVAIDMPAGPSEVLVIADNTCKPSFVAADLLSQAEHGVDSQVILLCTDQGLAKKCLEEVNRQVLELPRKKIALEALAKSRIIVFENLHKCMEFSNYYAPEHLIIATEDSKSLGNEVVNAGSVFLGNYSCEAAGDYASGTNHTLPTNGFAKNFSGVSLDSFVKKITFQEISKEGIVAIGPAVECMAEEESLIAHKNAVTVRLKEISND